MKTPWILLPALATLAAAADFKAVDVAASPARIELAPGEELAEVSYVFTNTSDEAWEVTERSAFWHSLENKWQSRMLGPIPTRVTVPARGKAEWKDRARLWDEILNGAAEAQGMASGELLLVQQFTLEAADGEKTHVAASLIFRTGAGNAKLETFDLDHYRVTTLASFRADETKKRQLEKLTGFADAAYESLAKVVGFEPGDGARVPLRIVAYGGYPHYTAADGGYVNIPCEVVESQATSEWLFVAYPHELTHYFLLQEFPNPPRWFIEGPASFFGLKVARELGYEKMEKADRGKILGWAGMYRVGKYDYLFRRSWPKDGPEGNLTEMGSFGMGRAFELCSELEKLCGEDFFRRVFRHMQEKHVAFPADATEEARNDILIQAMQSQTDRDLGKFFTEAGHPRP